MTPAVLPAFLNRLPKVDIHCHLVGALRPGTLAALARKHGISLPRPEHQLYDFEDFYAFLDTLRLAATVMRDAWGDGGEVVAGRHVALPVVVPAPGDE